jgi:hypothetical protein
VNKFSHATLAIAAVILTVALSIWAWNTLAVLYGGPSVQAKHAIAALILVGLLRRIITPTRYAGHRRLQRASGKQQ